jgi:hypothetical protein
LVAASLVWIEQQLTQGDENDSADDRRKEYGGKETDSSMSQRARFGVPSQCNTLCKPLVLWATSA